MNICVHTSLSWRGEAKPHVFFVGGHRLIVAGVLQRWVEHPHCYYEVTCDDGRRFLLCYDSARDAWELAAVYAQRQPKAVRVAARTTPQPRRWWSALLSARTR